MPNPNANLEALTVLLFQEQAAKPNDHVTFAELQGTPFVALARRLADRGVLAISALTLEQLGDLTCLDERVMESPVDYLRSIARGRPNA